MHFFYLISDENYVKQWHVLTAKMITDEIKVHDADTLEGKTEALIELVKTQRMYIDLGDNKFADIMEKLTTAVSGSLHKFNERLEKMEKNVEK